MSEELQPEALRLADNLDRFPRGLTFALLDEPGKFALAGSTARQSAAELRRQHVELTRLHEELETERMRLAACGVVAISNTPGTAERARKMDARYWSASCADVAAAVDREMKMREEKALLAEALQELEEAARKVQCGEMELQSINVERMKASAALAKVGKEK